MGFVEGLPKSNGKEVIFVIVDSFTKYAHFVALSHPYTAAQVAQIFLDNIYKLNGSPVSTLSDRDPVFTSLFWEGIVQRNGSTTQEKHSLPSTDGWPNREVKQMSEMLPLMHDGAETCSLER